MTSEREISPYNMDRKLLWVNYETSTYKHGVVFSNEQFLLE